MKNTTRLDPDDFPSPDRDLRDRTLNLEDLVQLVPALKERGMNRLMNDWNERSGYDDEGR